MIKWKKYSNVYYCLEKRTIKNIKKIKKIEISSQGTNFVKIKNYNGSFVFQSKLSVRRALIFRNPDPNSQENFEVLNLKFFIVKIPFFKKKYPSYINIIKIEENIQY